MRKLGLAALTALAAAPFANAQLIVGNDQSGTATIWHVDVNTGAATALYASSTSEAKPWGMAYDQSSNTLYWNNGSTLYKSPFSLGGLTPQTVGTMMFNAATINFVGMGFKDGKLWFTRNIATEAVYSLDPNTLLATQEYVYPSAFDFGGTEIDPVTGSLYALNDAGGAGTGTGLYKIDVLGQTQVEVAPYPGGETDIDGLAVYNDIAYYITDGPNTSQANFYVFDVNTGLQTGTLPSPFTGSGTFSAGTYVIPTPGALALLGLTGLTINRRRR